MDSVTLDGSFRLWSYGVGHSQLLLHVPPPHDDDETLSVLFEGVRAMKLRTSYDDLTLRPADPATRTRLTGFAGGPEFLREREVCLVLPTEEDGFVVCARARVIRGRQSRDQPGWRWPNDAEVLHAFLTPHP